MARSLNVEILADASQYERTLRKAARSTQQFNTGIKKQGLSLGKTFAGAFGIGLGAAGLVRGLQTVIAEATEHATVQKQLEAQFKASGVALQDYQAQIDETVNRLSILAGVDDEEVLTSFTAVFRATKDVQLGLKITAIAADVAKGAHKDLGQTTLALTKVLGGQNTALKRLGILLPAGVTGMEAINFVAQKFAGQAAAGTTSQERFNIALKNMEEAIGTALLPTVNKFLDQLTVWLGDTENQKKLQDGLTGAIDKTAKALGFLADAWDIAAAGVDKYNAAVEKFHGLPQSIQDAIKKGAKDALAGVPGVGGLQALLNAIKAAKAISAGKKITGTTSDTDRVPGRSPGGPGGGGEAAAAAAAVLRGRKRRASLALQMSQLNLQLAKAELTASQRDDRAILVRQAALLRRQIAVTKDLKVRTELYQQLGSVNKQIDRIDEDAAQDQEEHHQKELDTRKKIAEAAKAHAAKVKAAMAAQRAALVEQQLAAQFRALGLSGTGEELIPTSSLRKQLGKLADSVKGTVLDTKATRALLDRIRTVLSGGLGNLSRDVRERIKQMLDELAAQLDQGEEKVKKKKRRIQFDGPWPTSVPSGLTHMGTPAGVPIPAIWQQMAKNPKLLPPALQPGIHIQKMELHLHGVQDVRQLENELVKRSTTRPQPRRGP